MDSVEYEVRLGIKTGRCVSSNIGRRAYDLLLETLYSCKDLAHSKMSETDTYYTNSLRRSSASNALESKVKVLQEDQRFGKFNIRYCVSFEDAVCPEQGVPPAKFTREKERHRFSNRRLNIDLTHIRNTDSYELEIEATRDYAWARSSAHIKAMLIDELKNLVSCANL